MRRTPTPCPAIAESCAGRSPSLLPLLKAKAFHRNRRSRASNRAQPAADADLLVIKKDTGGLSRRAPAFKHRRVVQVALQHEMQTVLGADVDASIAQDALGAVIDRMNVTVQASLALRASLRLGIAQFDFGDTAAAIQRH